MTPGPASRKCTPYLLAGPGGMPLALRLSEGLGSAARGKGAGAAPDKALLLLVARSKASRSAPEAVGCRAFEPP